MAFDNNKLGELRPNQLITTFGPGSIVDAVKDSVTVLDTNYWAEKGKKIILDAGGYKETRAEKVKDIALRAIEKVKETGRWQKLKPMTAYERRIVHQIINDAEGVTGESSGVEPNRYLTIYPEKKD